MCQQLHQDRFPAACLEVVKKSNSGYGSAHSRPLLRANHGKPWGAEPRDFRFAGRNLRPKSAGPPEVHSSGGLFLCAHSHPEGPGYESQVL